MKGGIRVRGKLRLADGSPVTDARFQFAFTGVRNGVVSRSLGNMQSRTDAHGEYQFINSDPGVFIFKAQYGGLRAESEPVYANEEGADLDGVDLVLR